MQYFRITIDSHLRCLSPLLLTFFSLAVLHWVSFSILIAFLLEMVLLLVGYGKAFFSKWLYVMDSVIILCSVATEVFSNPLYRHFSVLTFHRFQSWWRLSNNSMREWFLYLGIYITEWRKMVMLSMIGGRKLISDWTNTYVLRFYLLIMCRFCPTTMGNRRCYYYPPSSWCSRLGISLVGGIGGLGR